MDSRLQLRRKVRLNHEQHLTLALILMDIAVALSVLVTNIFGSFKLAVDEL